MSRTKVEKIRSRFGNNFLEVTKYRQGDYVYFIRPCPYLSINCYSDSSEYRAHLCEKCLFDFFNREAKHDCY